MTDFRISPLRLAICASLPLLLFSRAGAAAEWYAQAKVSTQSFYNDNILLSTKNNRDAASGFSVGPQLDFGRRGPNWDTTGQIRLRNTYYHGTDLLDRKDRYVDLSSRYATERSMWQLRGGLSRDSFVTTETLNPDTGLIEGQRVWKTRSVTPSWTLQVSERGAFEFNYTYSDVHYEDGRSLGLLDYRTQSAGLSYIFRMSERNRLSLQGSYNLFTVPRVSDSMLGETVILGERRTLRTETQTDSYQIGWTHSFSESMTGTISLGRRRTYSELETEICVQGPIFIIVQDCTGTRIVPRDSEKDEGTVYSVELNQRLERGQLSGSMSHNVSASGSGIAVETTSVGLGLRYDLTPTLKASLNGSAFKVRAISEDQSAKDRVDRQYYRAGPGLQWQWTPEFKVDVSYQTTHLEYEALRQPTRSNALYLTLTYQWPRMAISR